MNITIPRSVESKSTPTNYFWICDLSGSMTYAIKDLKATLGTIRNLLTPQDTLTLGYFSSAGDFRWICKASANTEGLAKIIEEKIYARGLTCFVEILADLKDTVVEVVTLTNNPNNALFFLTDGYPNDRSPESEVIRLCRELGPLFNQQKAVIGYGGYYNRKLLIEMAEVLGGDFNHVSDFDELKPEDMVAPRQVKVVEIKYCYDLIWQVSAHGIAQLQCVGNTNTVEVVESDVVTELYGVDFDELDTLDPEILTDAGFIYSLAYVLSQKDKANFGVALLNKAGAKTEASLLRKAFTVTQKGMAENELKALAVTGGVLTPKEMGKVTPLNEFLDMVNTKAGKISIDLGHSPYKRISRKTQNVSKVEFKATGEGARIQGLTSNEDRANLSFLTVQDGEITAINDADLLARVNVYNRHVQNTPITLPLEASTFKNFSLIANGDFNFDRLVLTWDNEIFAINPRRDLELFPEDKQEYKASDLTKLYTAMFAAKTHASVLRYYIKQLGVKHAQDLRRDTYGAEGAALLEEMGLDYMMRYSPPRQAPTNDELQDYIPFVEMTCQMKGASSFSASKSHEKMKKKGSPNPAAAVAWPLFEQYDALMKLGDETSAEVMHAAKKGVDATVEVLASKVSSIKFYLMMTNSWFTDVPKADEFIHEGVLVRTTEVKEYV